MQGSEHPRHPRLEVIRRNGDPGRTNPPLLFVHGAWHGAWCWDFGFLERVSKHGFDVFAMSLRGHGNSAGHERLRTTRVRDFVDDIEEVADSLFASPVVVGHSMGGFLTQKLMERRRLPGAVLLASMPPSGVAGFVGKLIRTDPLLVLQANLTLRPELVVSTPDRVKRLFFSESVPDKDAEFYASKLGNEAFFAYLDMLLGDLCTPAKGTPVLVLGAEKDAIFPVKTQNEIAASYATQPIIFPMAHDMMLEPGWESVADAIAHWVSEGLQRIQLVA
ncbi:alpha/beta hydrolase [Methylocystis parvus]|uniref:alpha/beta hydrolase n=1 Tax=Methylocystis parvus TaxID=134 RepID=UPI003C74A28E